MSEKYRLHFRVPALPELPQKRRHWSIVKRHADDWRTAVRIAVGNRRPDKPLRQARLTLTRHSSREPDFDNLVASFKCVVDALCKSKKVGNSYLSRANVIEDDRSRNVVARNYQWREAKPGEGAIEVCVEEV